MITPSVVHYSLSCVLLGQLCTTRSVVSNHSVSCMFLRQLCIFDQLCITRSVVHYSISCAFNTRGSVVHYSVSCTLLGQVCIILSVVDHD